MPPSRRNSSGESPGGPTQGNITLIPAPHPHPPPHRPPRPLAFSPAGTYTSEELDDLADSIGTRKQPALQRTDEDPHGLALYVAYDILRGRTPPRSRGQPHARGQPHQRDPALVRALRRRIEPDAIRRVEYDRCEGCIDRFGGKYPWLGCWMVDGEACAACLANGEECAYVYLEDDERGSSNGEGGDEDSDEDDDIVFLGQTASAPLRKRVRWAANLTAESQPKPHTTSKGVGKSCLKNAHQWRAGPGSMLLGSIVARWSVINPTISDTLRLLDSAMVTALLSRATDLDRVIGRTNTMQLVRAWGRMYDPLELTLAANQSAATERLLANVAAFHIALCELVAHHGMAAELYALLTARLECPPISA